MKLRVTFILFIQNYPTYWFNVKCYTAKLLHCYRDRYIETARKFLISTNLMFPNFVHRIRRNLFLGCIKRGTHPQIKSRSNSFMRIKLQLNVFAG